MIMKTFAFSRDKNLGLGLLPGENYASDVSECGGLLEEQVPHLVDHNDAAGPELEVPLDNLHELLLPLGL